MSLIKIAFILLWLSASVYGQQDTNCSSCSKEFDLADPGKYDAEIKAYDDVIILDPNNFNAWQKKGWALVDHGQYDEAIKAYDEAIRIDPNNACIWINKGFALFKLGMYDEAIKILDEAIRLDPENGKTQYGKGDSLRKLGRHSEASAAYAKAHELGFHGRMNTACIDETGRMIRCPSYKDEGPVYE